jgi:exosortase K
MSSLRDEEVGKKSLLRQQDTLFQRATWKVSSQLLVVLLCAVAVKLYYSTASVNQLRWILAPTTFLVELVSGYRFEFESHAGYINSDRSFVIAAACAGINFLITAFLMLALRKLWVNRLRRSYRLAWSFIPVAAVTAYLATLVANTVRISTALRMRGLAVELNWLSPNQLHRFEGIFVYFGFLLLLFVIEKMDSENSASKKSVSLFRQSFFPLLIYYATTLGIPLANGAYRTGTAADFYEHSVFVLLTPLLLILPLSAFRFYRHQLQTRQVYPSRMSNDCTKVRTSLF